MSENVVPHEVIRRKATQRHNRQAAERKLGEYLGIQEQPVSKEGQLVVVDFAHKVVILRTPIQMKTYSQYGGRVFL